jgi:hypothetical protein
VPNLQTNLSPLLRGSCLSSCLSPLRL